MISMATKMASVDERMDQVRHFITQEDSVTKDLLGDTIHWDEHNKLGMKKIFEMWVPRFSKMIKN